MVARLFVDPLPATNEPFALPAAVARHVQVLRLAPGTRLTLFDGQGGEWDAELVRIGRREAVVHLLAHHDGERELPLPITLALGMPANERMDALVEKATELGAAAIEPLVCARSVLRLAGERAERRRAHWQEVAVSAAEQCGRTRIPRVAEVRSFAGAIARDDGATLLLLSLDAQAMPLAQAWPPLLAARRALRLVSGPEGGLTEDEQRLAIAAGALPLSLGPRILRADTAPLAALAALAAVLG